MMNSWLNAHGTLDRSCVAHALSACLLGVLTGSDSEITQGVWLA